MIKKSVEIDTARKIALVKMFVHDRFLQSLRLEDAYGGVIAELPWCQQDEEGEWQEF